MKNYEFYKDKLSTGEMICVSAFICRHGENCKDIECSNCAFYENLDLSLCVLFDEHKEQVKLKRWEKDLLETLQCEEVKFCCHELLLEMRHKGHFKGISDIDMNLREILDNCEVIDD